jgi:hypothetical protein
MNNHNFGSSLMHLNCYNTIIDVDECHIFPNGYCDRNARCMNTNGSHLCTCNSGFIGNGRTCVST